MATIQAGSGLHDALKADLLEIASLTRREAGCIQFDIHEDEQTPGVFILWEHFASQADFDRHLAMPYTRDYFAKGHALATHVVPLKRLK